MSLHPGNNTNCRRIIFSFRGWHAKTGEIAQRNRSKPHSRETEKGDPNKIAARENVFAAIQIMHTINYYDPKYEIEYILGIQNFLSTVCSAINTKWDEPTSSILQLKLDFVIKLYLFYFNGVATIGQLQKAQASEEKLLRIGESRIGKIQEALRAYQNEQVGEHLAVLPEKIDDFQSSAFGVWSNTSKGRGYRREF